MLRFLWICFKIALLLVLVVEASSFLAMTVHNYLIYGRIWGHVPVRYDPHALFVMTETNPEPRFNSVSSDPEANRIIWMFGGSTVRGNAHWDANKTLPAFLSQFLNATHRPLHFTVLNFGENGFNSVLETKYLQKVLITKSPRPDLVIFYDGANDAFQFAEYRQPEGHFGYRRLKAFVESYRSSWFGLAKPINAAIYASYTKELFDKLNLFLTPVEPDSPNLREMVRIAVKRYDHVHKVVHCYGSEFLLIWQPLLWVEQCRPAPDLRREEASFFLDTKKFHTMGQSVTATYGAMERALESKPYFLNLRQALCKRTVPVYWPDGIHLKDQGREMVAERIGRAVLRKFPDRFHPNGSSPANAGP